MEKSKINYRVRNNGKQILLSYSQAGPGRTVKQEQEEISRNHVPSLFAVSVYDPLTPVVLPFVKTGSPVAARNGDSSYFRSFSCFRILVSAA